MEYMNLKRDPAKKQVSVYVEGIGTVDYAQDQEDAGIPRAAVSNDDQDGYAFGTGPTGIYDRVTKGINEAKKQINRKEKPIIYSPKFDRIEKIVVDVVGFSRGAAGARHFVSRREALQKDWTGGERPEIVINFVGLYDTVSSYEKTGTLVGNSLDKLTAGSFEGGIFDDDVKELGLNMGGIPWRVVHLTASDEYRTNFSLTTINTSLAANVGFELELPGVHSDVGGSYVEPDPNNPTMDLKLRAKDDPTLLQGIRDLNKEVRRIRSDLHKQWLIAQGWYKPEQFEPWKPVTFVKSHKIPGLEVRTPEIAYREGDNGVRYLTNEYQYVALFIMLDFAQYGAGRPGGKAHLKLEFESLGLAKNTRYRVPAALVSLRDEFLAEAVRLTGSRQHERVSLLTTAARFDTLRWLRNHYLHRSARLPTEGKAYLGMDGNLNQRRTIIADNVLVDKYSTRAVNEAQRRAEQLKRLPGQVKQSIEQGVRHKLDELRKLF